MQLCGHRFETECLRDYFNAQVKTNTLEHIQCPEADCRKKPARDEIQRILGEEDFVQYERIETNLKVAQSRGNLKQCPYPNCDGVYDMSTAPSLRDKLLGNDVVCPVCQGAFCKECNLQSHKG